jgi:hypothetical protein
MKKTIIKLSLLAALFVGFSSCEDATNITQESELSEENAYRNVDDLRSGLIGAYSQYAPDSGSNGTGDIIIFNELFTDGFKRGKSSSGQGNEEYQWILQPGSDFPTRLWSNRYAVINYANRVLDAWDRIAPELTDDQEIDQANEIKGQLLALRALCHFDLLQYFTPDYQDDNAPSVIIMDFVPEITQTFPRNTAGEVFAFINNDLADATTLIDDFSTIGDYTGDALQDVYYINPDVIKAIKARVALFEGNYALAESLANELIAEYPLSNPAQYEGMFLDDNLSLSTELIFSLSRRINDRSAVRLFYANEANFNGSPFYEASNQLYNLYAENDIRRDLNIIQPDGGNDGSLFAGINSPDNVLLIGKYRGSGDDPTINDIKIFRTSEMVLIKAEAEARDGRLAQAAASVRTIRNARKTDTGMAPLPVYGSTFDALTDILLERRKELAFEGHRYLDLKRIGTEIGVGISRNSVDCGSFFAPCDLAAGNYRFTLPIPRVEINANPTIQQNTGY